MCGKSRREEVLGWITRFVCFSFLVAISGMALRLSHISLKRAGRNESCNLSVCFPKQRKPSAHMLGSTEPARKVREFRETRPSPNCQKKRGSGALGLW